MKKKILKAIIISVFITSTFNINVQASATEYIIGNDRYETAGLIADKLNYSSAVIVNGASIADGLSASGLSGSINAPILLTQNNNLPKATLKRLKKVNTVYLVGGTGVISQKVENTIKNLGKKVVRLAEQNRYDTSYAVANEINKIKDISELYYVNGLTVEADAMSIAPVAAKKEIQLY